MAISHLPGRRGLALVAALAMFVAFTAGQPALRAECATYTIVNDPQAPVPPTISLTVRTNWGPPPSTTTNDVIPPPANPYTTPGAPPLTFMSVTIVGSGMIVGTGTTAYYPVTGGCIKFRADRDANGCIVITVSFYPGTVPCP